MGYDAGFDSDENRALLAICTRKLIRNIGIGGILWGIINVGIGIVAIQVTIINAGILILAALMLATGIQAIRNPTLGVLLTEAIVGILLFLWNLSVTILNFLAEGKFTPAGLVVPLVVAVVLVNSYRKLGHLRGLIAAVPPEKIKATQQICKALVKKKLKDEPLIVQTGNRRCRAQLMDGQALFIQRDLMRAFVLPKDTVRSAVAKPDAKKWKLVFQHPLGALKYHFDKKNTEKLRTWLAAEQAAPAN